MGQMTRSIAYATFLITWIIILFEAEPLSSFFHLVSLLIVIYIISIEKEN